MGLSKRARIALLVAAAVVAAWIAAVTLWLDTERYGNTAEWVGGIGTAAAVGFALLDLRQQRLAFEQKVQADRLKEMRAQADLVSAWCEGTVQSGGPSNSALTLQTAVRNASDLPVYQLAVRVYPEGDWGPEANNWAKKELGTVGPGKTTKTEVRMDGPVRYNLQSDTPVAVEFRDIGGRFWLREPDGTLKLR